MTNNDELALKLKSAAEKATVLNLDTAQIERGNDGYYECPVCCGAGEVEAKTDFCNIDGVALGVQFYGIGEHHGAAEEYFRTAAPANILTLLAERDADKKQLAVMSQAFLNLKLLADVYLHAYEEAKASVAELQRLREEETMRANRQRHNGFMMATKHMKQHENVHYADAAEVEIAALHERISELEAAAASKFMPVGVMSQSKFESLDNGHVRFIALWPRPCVPVRRKRPDDGVLVYAKVAGINLEVGE